MVGSSLTQWVEMSAVERVSSGSHGDGRGDRAAGVEERDLVSWRQVERRASFERAGHPLALVVHYIRHPPDGDALILLHRDIAVDRNAGRAWRYLRALRIEDP